MGQARWRPPNGPRRIAIYGDVRMRGEGHFFDAPVYDKAGLQIGGNYLDFVDWGRINGGDGFQSNQTAPGYVKPPYLNTAEDRRRFQLRARFGLKVKIADGIAADIRVATGNNNSPVSTNQTLGGDGGGKYHLWLDRASPRLDAARKCHDRRGPFRQSLLVQRSRSSTAT